MKPKSKKITAAAAVLAMLTASMPGMSVPAAAEGEVMKTFYVSPNAGNGDGTESAPFSTLQQAVDAVRANNSSMTGDIIVYLDDGTYELDSTIELGSSDSGTNGYKIQYRAKDGAKPVISGGNILSGTWTDEGNGIYSIPLDRGEKLRSMFVNGKRAYMTCKALEGKGGYGTYTVTAGNGDWAWADGTTAEGTILPMDATLFSTRNPEDVELESRMTWKTSTVCVDHFEDIGDSQMAAILQMPYGAIGQSLQTQSKYSTIGTQYVWNVFEWLDEPGEFYFDKSAKKLYYYPRTGEDLATAEVVIPKIDKLIDMAGVNTETRIHDISFTGLTFAYTDWNMCEIAGSHGRCGCQGEVMSIAATFDKYHPSIYRGFDVGPAAVCASSAYNLSFTDNTFCHTANDGLELVNDVSNVTVNGNIMYDIGGSAVLIGHPQHMYIGDKGSDKGTFSEKEKYDIGVKAACNNISVTNNYIYNACDMFRGNAGIIVFAGDHLTLQYNHIEEVPWAGISIGWGWWNMDGSDSAVVPGEAYATTNDNIIKNNVLTKTIRTLADTGAVYTLGDMPNSVISENYISGIGSDDVTPTYHIRGIHPDEGTKHLYGEKNVIEIPSAFTCIDCGSWGDGVKGYNTWDNNYSTSSSYATTTARETGTTITNAHTVPSGYWDKTVFDIIRGAGVKSSYYKELPESFKVQDILLPTKFVLDAGTVLDLGIGEGDIDGEIWLAPKGTTDFAAEQNAVKAENGTITVPSARLT